MAETLKSYLDNITSEHRDKPDFIAMITALVEPYIYLQELNDSLLIKFDLETAVGQQLDVIGEWAGVSRQVNIPITGIFFEWDGPAEQGWEGGIWRGDNNATSINRLPDDNYRILIKAKIAANQWDGTTEGAYEIFQGVFPNAEILIQDNQNMTYNMAIVGSTIDALTIALLTGGYLPLKPEGVRIDNYYVQVDTNPLFAWDIENQYLGGWDEASWAKTLIPS